MDHKEVISRLNKLQNKQEVVYPIPFTSILDKGIQQLERSWDMIFSCMTNDNGTYSTVGLLCGTFTIQESVFECVVTVKYENDILKVEFICLETKGESLESRVSKNGHYRSGEAKYTGELKYRVYNTRLYGTPTMCNAVCIEVEYAK